MTRNFSTAQSLKEPFINLLKLSEMHTITSSGNRNKRMHSKIAMGRIIELAFLVISIALVASVRYKVNFST